jgi:anti-sigma B factor antagonist
MTATGLATEIEDIGGVQVVHVTGPLDSMTHDSFKDLLDPMVSQPHFRIVLDCEHLTYVNSRGLTLLARYQRATGQSVSFFGVAALNSRITKAIELLGMGKLVHLYPDVADALKAAAAL